MAGRSRRCALEATRRQLAVDVLHRDERHTLVLAETFEAGSQGWVFEHRDHGMPPLRST
ncbi:MAG: hypothetical protein HZA23_05355 [Nitrospirae bacterium]|nr:hypothetical protein [Nitrospirota bacterium]